MGLFDFLRKQVQQQNSTPVKTNSFGESLDHLDADGELPWGWITANKQFTEKIQGESQRFMNQWIEAEQKGFLEEYHALKAYLAYLHDTKEYCESKGECFAKWFSDIIASKKNIAKWTARLKSLESNLSEFLNK